MRSVVLVAVALLLTGCADRGQLSPGPIAPGEATYESGDFLKPMPVEWVHVASGDLHLDALNGVHTSTVTAPNGTLHLDVNLTLTAGTTMDLRILFDACDLSFNGTIAATGQTLPFDCGRIPDVTSELRIMHRNGDVLGRFTVDAMVCGRPGARYGCG